MHPDEYRAFTEQLTERLRADERAIGLVAVGSMADRDYAPDEWSDHAFFLITPPGTYSSSPSSTSRRSRSPASTATGYCSTAGASQSASSGSPSLRGRSAT